MSTHTYAVLPVSQATYDEIAELLKQAHYARTIKRLSFRKSEPDVLDMNGLALSPTGQKRQDSRDQTIKELRHLVETGQAAVHGQIKEICKLRRLLKEIDVGYWNKKVELPKKLHGKIVNKLGLYPDRP